MTRLLALIAFVVAILLFFLYVEPTYSGAIAMNEATITSDDQALAAASQYTAKQNELITAESQISPTALASLTTFLPDSPGDVGLILDLDALAARDGLNLTGIDVAGNQQTAAAAAATPGGPPYASLDLTLSATGSYSAFRSFLTSIEQSSRLLDVEQLTVTGSNSGVYTYLMTLRLYWLQ